MKVFLVDAYDSFIFIISQYLEDLGLKTCVERNDVENLADRIEAYTPGFCVLGPGPGHPAEAGYVELIRRFEGRVPLLGVCLGHQAIGLAYGGRVERAQNVMHGKVSTIHNDGRGVFAHIGGNDFDATRYHSLIVTEDSVPADLEVSSHAADDGYVMGLRHRSMPVEGVQFHPESILTEHGRGIFRSFIDTYCLP